MTFARLNLTASGSHGHLTLAGALRRLACAGVRPARQTLDTDQHERAIAARSLRTRLSGALAAAISGATTDRVRLPSGPLRAIGKAC